MHAGIPNGLERSVHIRASQLRAKRGPWQNAGFHQRNSEAAAAAVIDDTTTKTQTPRTMHFANSVARVLLLNTTAAQAETRKGRENVVAA